MVSGLAKSLAKQALVAALALSLAACGAVRGGFFSPTPSPNATATPDPTPTSTPLPTATPSPLPSSTATAVPSAAPLPSPTPTPWPTPDGVERTAGVPILMYHHIAVPPAGADAIRRDLSVSPAAFEEQLRYLKEQGYRSISLYQLNRHLQRGDPLPEKPIVFTFDDGYDDNFAYAFPLLVKYGFTGTFFLITEPIDAGREGYMTWPQVSLMSRMGMDMEPHTYTHPDLTGQPVDYIVWQVIGSKEAIEERTGKTCRFFSYPSGRYDAPVVDVLRSAHFWGAVTVQTGVTHTSGGMFDLARIRVRGSDSLDTFVTKLNLDY